jgi:RimJ/RimL family protein N-acetyltransferase
MAGVLLVQLQESTLPPVNSNRSAWRSGAQLSPPIETARLTLRPLRESDLEQLVEIQSRPEVAQYTYWEPRKREAVQQWLALAMAVPALEADNQCLTLAAVERESDRLAGTLTFFLRSGEHQQGEIGLMFLPEFQGRGLAAEGDRVVLRLGFEVMRLHRIFGHCDGHNLPSARLMERLGRRQAAELIQNEWVKGEWTDDWIYAILNEEWRQALRTRP